MKKLAAQTRGSERRLRTTACSRRQGDRPGEEGYVLLTLLLVVALMAIFALGVIIPVKFANQRDQEQEMIHRGVQYSRAIRAYYKKFGRFPTKLEDLDNTNNLRYLRKHYKDPLNKNGDFKLLHYGDPGVTLGGGFSIGGGSIPGATAAGSPSGLNGSGPSSSGFGNSGFGNSGFGGSGSGGSSFGSSGSGNSGVNSNGVFSQSSGLGGNSNSGFGAGSNNAPGSNGTSGNQTASPDGSQGGPSTPDDSGSTKINANGASDQSSSTQPVSGGPIVGVASISKKTTIREYNHKKRYNEWQFLYDPALDRGGLITTPYQPGLALGAGMQQPNLNAQPAGSTTGNSFGNSPGNSFGQSSGFGNNANPGGSSPQPQPPANPPQQQ
jgi:type II secretory pathway pseudopilin PulG